MPGTVYVEVRLRQTPSYGTDAGNTTNTADDKDAVSKAMQKLFDDGKITAAKLNLEMCGLDDYGSFPQQVESVKVVEYVGSESCEGYFPVTGCRVVINTYCWMDHRDANMKRDVQEELLLDFSTLPSLQFDGYWESIIYETAVKEDLVKCLTNLLSFSKMVSSKKSPCVNRLILLAGPPGTGKSTLAVSLAQKLSIRLNNVFPNETLLFQLNAATLLSQFFGQSAVKIHEVFEALWRASASSPLPLCILVIDEVESLAGCRSKANAQGEVQDAVRATNALLTGLDRVMGRPNVLVICTSNLESTIDQAFIDRCSKRIEVGPPSAAGRYGILRHGIECLIERGLVAGEELALPNFDGAECRLAEDFDTVGCRLRRFAEKSDYLRGSSTLVSARWLSQLPELALAQQLEVGALSCTLEQCLEYIEVYSRSLCPSRSPCKNVPVPSQYGSGFSDIRAPNFDRQLFSPPDSRPADEISPRKRTASHQQSPQGTKRRKASVVDPALPMLDENTLDAIVRRVIREINAQKPATLVEPPGKLDVEEEQTSLRSFSDDSEHMPKDYAVSSPAYKCRRGTAAMKNRRLLVRDRELTLEQAHSDI